MNHFNLVILSCILLAASSAQPVSGQVWCPPGATWVYDLEYLGTTMREEYRYVGDTLVEGYTAHYVEVISLHHTSGITYYGDQITAIEDDVLLYRHALTGTLTWDTLHWLGALPGDRWWPPGAFQECAPEGMLEVMDTTTVELDGLQLRQWQMGYLDQDGIAYPAFSFTERIGSVPRIPHILGCAVIDYFFPTLLCYSDDEVSVGDGPCEMTLSTSERSVESQLIYPNPGSDGFKFELGPDLTVDLRILDLQGREISRSRLQDGQWVSMQEWPPGTYLVEVMANGRRWNSKWIKE